MNKLDARMRRMLAGLDAAPGFEERLMQRIAAQAAKASAPSADLRSQYERRRELARRRMRREAWSGSVTIAGVGVAAGALVWRFREPIMQWVAAADLVNPSLIGAVTLVAVCAAFWPILRMVRMVPGFRND